jgi:hypothetical protein
LLEHFGVGQRIREERKMVDDRVERVRRKLGELRCVVEFEMVEGVKGERERRGKLEVAGKYNAKDNDKFGGKYNAKDNDKGKAEETQTSNLLRELRMVSS